MTKDELNALHERLNHSFPAVKWADVALLLAEVERLHAIVQQNGGSVHESIEGFVERMRRERDNAVEQNGRAATVAIRERDAAFRRGVAAMREAAAQACDSVMEEALRCEFLPGRVKPGVGAAIECADAIRALPDHKDKP